MKRDKIGRFAKKDSNERCEFNIGEKLSYYTALNHSYYLNLFIF